MYLIEALRYNVPAFHEDRLTQIVAATFNESKYFQKIFLRFLGIKNKTGLRAKTQVANEAAPSRPDLILFDNDEPFAVIESKVSAKSDKRQQNHHSRLKARYYFLIVRDPVQQIRIGNKFKKVTWSDFFSFISNFTTTKQNSTDSFLLNKLLNFGKESKMLYPNRLLMSDFENASTLFSQIRLKGAPSFAFEERNPFQSLDSISLFLERALMKIKDDPSIGPKIKPFTRRLKVNNLYVSEIHEQIAEEVGAAERSELRLKVDTVALDKEMRLKKPIRGYHYLYVRVAFVPHYKNRCTSDLKFETIKRMKIEDIDYRCQISAGFIDNERTSREFFYFDDRDDLLFARFYRAAVKGWKNEISRR